MALPKTAILTSKCVNTYTDYKYFNELKIQKSKYLRIVR